MNVSLGDFQCGLLFGLNCGWGRGEKKTFVEIFSSSLFGLIEYVETFILTLISSNKKKGDSVDFFLLDK